MIRFLTRLVAVFLVLGLPAGCSPSLSPLYRDYEVARGDAPEDLRAAIEAALVEAGWTPVAASAPNVVATETRVFNDWGLYKTEAFLEVAPLGDRYVRVLVHPYRKYITGGRSKIPYMKGGLRRALLPELNRAFEAHGLYLLGTAIDRDREATDG